MSKPPEQKQASTQVPWVSPRVRAGDTVFWSRNEGSEQCLAIVTKVGDSAISVSLINEGSRELRPIDSVRHVKDPSLSVMPARDGVWRHTPQTEELQKILAILPDLAG